MSALTLLRRNSSRVGMGMPCLSSCRTGECENQRFPRRCSRGRSLPRFGPLCRTSFEGTQCSFLFRCSSSPQRFRTSHFRTTYRRDRLCFRHSSGRKGSRTAGRHSCKCSHCRRRRNTTCLASFEGSHHCIAMVYLGLLRSSDSRGRCLPCLL